MMVNGPLEIYSTVIGAKLYDSVFSILHAFGVVYIPLIVVFFKGITTAIEDSGDKALKKVALDVGLVILSLMIFVLPTKQLELSSIAYRKPLKIPPTISA